MQGNSSRPACTGKGKNMRILASNPLGGGSRAGSSSAQAFQKYAPAARMRQLESEAHDLWVDVSGVAAPRNQPRVVEKQHYFDEDPHTHVRLEMRRVVQTR